MDNKLKINIALTFDDAPSINEAGVKFISERMDRVREVLVQHNIKYCTAFVVGDSAVGHEGKLERWLQAGFQLANHTQNHRRSSELTEQEFEQSILGCDRFLETLGAFANKKARWFRFPYLDRGSDVGQRLKFQRIVNDLGYGVAHASMSFEDHLYEAPMESALMHGLKVNVDRISKRYANNVCNGIKFIDQQCANKFGQKINHIAYAHFGCISDLVLDSLLSEIAALNVEWSDLDSVASTGFFNDFDKECLSNGLLLNGIKPTYSLVHKLRRKVAQMSVTANLFEQKRYGPIWAYLN